MSFRSFLCLIFGCNRNSPVRLRYYVKSGAFGVECNDMKTVTLSTAQFVDIEFTALAGNQPADLDGDPTVSSADESVATVSVDPDNPFSFRLNSVAPGTTQITISGDAELDDGVTTISETIYVQVTQAEANRFDVIVSEPQFKEPQG